jgi:uncharacterized protein (TIGR00369 family)
LWDRDVTPAAELTNLLDSQPKPDCAALTPFAVVAADFEQGFVRLEFAAQPAFRNHFGNIQGGFATAMLDAAVSIAAYAKLRQWLPMVEMKASFLEPVAIGPVIGEGRVLKVGRRLAFVEGRLLGAAEQPAIIVTATLLVPGA